MVCLLLAAGVHSSILTNHTNIKLGVVLDEHWVTKYGTNAGQIEEIITTAVELANTESLKHTAISVVWLQLDMESQEGKERVNKKEEMKTEITIGLHNPTLTYRASQ